MLENLGKNLPKELRNYIREVESKSGIKIPEEQRALLAKDLRDNVYTRLEGDALKSHQSAYNSSIRDRLIGEWEKMGGDVKVREWPRYQEPVYKKSGEILKNVGEKFDAHHINPQQMGGKHEWWNVHPLHIEDHLRGVHGKGSILGEIVKEVVGK